MSQTIEAFVSAAYALTDRVPRDNAHDLQEKRKKKKEQKKKTRSDSRKRARCHEAIPDEKRDLLAIELDRQVPARALARKTLSVKNGHIKAERRCCERAR